MVLRGYRSSNFSMLATPDSAPISSISSVEVQPINSESMTDQSMTDPSIADQWWDWRSFKIRYRVQGQGMPLILIHGFGASIDHWRHNIPALAQHYRVYALDLLGFGHSEKPKLNYSLELWEGLLVDFCQDVVQSPSIFIGNSIGALLSLMMVAHHPELSSGGVLLNVAGGLNHRPDELNAPLRFIMGAFAGVMATPVLGTMMFNLIRRRSQIQRTLMQVYGNKAAVTDELVEFLYQPSCDPGAQQVMASILLAPAGPKISDLLSQVHRPLCVLWGEADPWTPISAGHIFQTAAHQPLHPDAPVEFCGIPNTGHCPHDERPAIVNQKILTWLDQIG